MKKTIYKEISKLPRFYANIQKYPSSRNVAPFYWSTKTLPKTLTSGFLQINEIQGFSSCSCDGTKKQEREQRRSRNSLRDLQIRVKKVRMVADNKSKKAKTDEENAEQIDGELLLSIEKLQSIQDDLEKVQFVKKRNTLFLFFWV